MLVVKEFHPFTNHTQVGGTADENRHTKGWSYELKWHDMLKFVLEINGIELWDALVLRRTRIGKDKNGFQNEGSSKIQKGNPYQEES